MNILFSLHRIIFFLDIDQKEESEDKLSTPSVSLTELGPNLDKLWGYSCSITKGRNVSCVAWNRLNPVSVSFSINYNHAKNSQSINRSTY